jgi:hypothetical protein
MMKRVSYLVLIVVFTLLPLAALAGELDSPGDPTTPAGHMPTVDELYDYLTSGAAPGAAEPFQEPTGGPTSGTMKTLKEIYDDVKALLDLCTARPEQVLDSVEFFNTDPANWGARAGTIATQTVDNSTVNQAAGYYNAFDLSDVDTDLVKWNIRSGVTMFGVTGVCTRVAATGQTTSYAAGDDGAYQLGCGPVVSPTAGSNFTNYKRTSLGWTSAAGTGFVDHGDGTVTDTLTGLIWLTKANCPGAKRDWATALSDVAQLNSAGTMNGNNCNDTSNGGGHQTDWRLPNINELRSLFDPGQSAPYLPAGHPFTGVQSDFYWSSTTRAVSPGYAWFVHLYYGQVRYGSKTGSAYVWPVRGGQ